MQIRSSRANFALSMLCAVVLAPVAFLGAPAPRADCEGGDCGGDSGGGWIQISPRISFGGGFPCYPGRLGLCLGRLNGPIPGAALRPVPPPGPAPRVGPRGTWP